jgi:hypothetical protein
MVRIALVVVSAFLFSLLSSLLVGFFLSFLMKEWCAKWFRKSVLLSQKKPDFSGILNLGADGE